MFILRLIILLALAAPATLFAQTFPEKPIRLIVPYPAGGGADATARPLAEKLSELLGQRVIVENRGGAGGTIGGLIVAQAPPDGYTLFHGFNAGSHGTVLFFLEKVPYDPVKDFTPITNAVLMPATVVVPRSSTITSFKQLLEYAKENPGKLAYGSAGIGSPAHLAGVKLVQLTGLDMTHIPYQGTAPAMADLLGGQIPMGIVTLPNVLQHIKAGEVRLLAMVDDERHPDFPDVPTVAEHVPGFSIPITWGAIFGPPGLPQPILARLHKETTAALLDPKIRASIERTGLLVRTSTPEELGEMVKRDIEKYREIVTQAGLLAKK